MAFATFNTLKFANDLKAAGIPAKQAEAEAEVLSEALQVNLKDVATKDDLKALEAGSKADLKALEDRVSARFELAKADLKATEDRLSAKFDFLKWMFATSITINVAIFIRLFFFVRVPI